MKLLAVPLLLTCVMMTGCGATEDNAKAGSPESAVSGTATEAPPATPEVTSTPPTTEPPAPTPEVTSAAPTTEAPAPVPEVTSAAPTAPAVTPEVTRKTIPVTKQDKNPVYAVAPTGFVTNEEFSDGVRAVVTLRWKEVKGVSDNPFGPIPTGRLSLKNGASVVCSKFRSEYWISSNPPVFEEMTMNCPVKVMIGSAIKFTVTSSEDPT